MRTINLLLWLAFASSAFAQEAAPAEPWKWTLQQRLAARFDPQARAERIAADARFERAGRATSANVGTDKTGDVIRGASHPELFLPTELFELLVRDIYWSDEFRLGFQQTSDDILRTDDEWAALKERVQPYAANLSEERQLIDELGSAGRARRDAIAARLTQLRAGRCALEKQALRSARAYFGAERFDRFLYVVSAPGRLFNYGRGTPEMFEATRTRLLANERDCQ
jgi:hypothetical protein